MCKRLKILALEPFYGGSHQAFLDGWIKHSRHEWQLLELPDYKWKWRMRHAGITFARRVHDLTRSGRTWDAIWCSDMLHLPDFIALADRSLTTLPRIIYFHENQFTYPNQQANQRDYHYAFSNYLSALAADSVWFNSKFHQSEFLNACESFLKRMPDNSDVENVEAIRAKSLVQYPGVDFDDSRNTVKNDSHTIRILWNARWEHDKNPEDFFHAIRSLKSAGLSFRLNVVGQSFGNVPPVFETARTEFAHEIDHWGYASSRQSYLKILQESDVVFSTANHEFFGIGVVEAMSMGVVPLLPTRLSYPELLEPLTTPSTEALTYDGSVDDLVKAFQQIRSIRSSNAWGTLVDEIESCGRRFAWKNRAEQMDDAVRAVHAKHCERKADYGNEPE